MYKLMAILITLFILTCLCASGRDPKLLNMRSDYRIYTYAPVTDDCIIDRFSGERILTVSSDRLTETLVGLGDYTSYETRIIGDERTARNAIQSLGGRIVKQENRDTGITFYAYSPRFRHSVRVDGETVNLHVVVSGDTMTIASPIIRGCC